MSQSGDERIKEKDSNAGSSARYNGAMISKELMDILVCPVCKKPLTQKDDGTSLKCSECQRVYPIRDDIPIMLVDEATVERS